MSSEFCPMSLVPLLTLLGALAPQIWGWAWEAPTQAPLGVLPGHTPQTADRRSQLPLLPNVVSVGTRSPGQHGWALVLATANPGRAYPQARLK